MSDTTKRIADLIPSNLVMHTNDHTLALDDLKYLVQRRDQLSEKIKIGLVGLNGASLIAILGALGGSGAAASWIGLNENTAIHSTTAFAIGLALAGHSLNTTSRAYGREASAAYGRWAALNALLSFYPQDASPENYERYDEAMQRVHKAPLTGFQWSWRAIAAENLSGGAWLYGIAVPLCSKLNFTWPGLLQAARNLVGLG